ncbi:MAG: proteinase [Thermomicrobiales bacterium]|nr:MAG: proteinase [Thermomicrobiales bacterium]
MTRPLFEQTLANGLKVILRESHEAPIASFWIWYRVGSRNELPGLTGVSHWVEHMQFKGTPTFGKGAIFREVSKNGGVLNALTSNDWTAYFETLPAERLDLALRIESDRMTNSLFDPEETEAERTVILSERQGAENSPAYLLYEEVVATAFHAHPYQHPVIGFETDLRAITRDDLYAHYRRAYRPNNAFIVAAGDFDGQDLFARIERAFGSIEPGHDIPRVRVTEPPQRGERRVTLRRPAPTAYLRMAFHTPAGQHPDTLPLLVVDAILSGGKGMGLASGGPMGRSSRLYRSLVASGLARAAASEFEFYVDPFLFLIGVTALPGVEPGRIESVVDQELAKLAQEPVPDEEFTRALKQVKAQYVYSAEGVTNQAFWLGQMEMVDTYHRADTLVDELERVTPDDVRRVATTYFTPSNRTVGWLLPEGNGSASVDAEPSRVNELVPRYWSIHGLSPQPGAQARPYAFERFVLPGGITVLGQAHPDDPVVSVRWRVDAGAARDPGHLPGLAAFTARMLPRGTGRLTFEQFNETTDRLGATFAIDPGRSWIEVAIRCLREDLPTLLDLLAGTLRDPTFPTDEMEKVRAELIAAVREQDNDTRAVADRALRQLLYPEGHPFRHRVIGEEAALAAITRDDLIEFHRAFYGPKVSTVAIVGGVPAADAAAQLIAQRFDAWVSDAAPAPPAPVPPLPTGQPRASETIPAKSQTDLAIGTITIERLHPDYYALDMANLILGRLGLMGRLGANVRDRQGLAYYAFSAIEPGRTSSVWLARAGVDPRNTERALSAIIEEVARLRDDGVTDEELADGKSFLTGSLPIALETNDGLATTLLNIEHYGLGLDYLERYPEIIQALTRDDVQRAATAHLDPSRLAVGIAGPPFE